MAIEDTSANGTTPTPGTPTGYKRTPADQPHPPREETKEQHKQHHRVGFGSVNEILRRSGSSESSENRSSEALTVLRAVTKELIESQTVGDDFELVRFDRDQNQVGLPSVLIVKFFEHAGGRYAAVRPLLLDTRDVRLPPRQLNAAYGRNRAEIPTRPQDVYNETYWDRIEIALMRTFNNENMTVVDAGPLLLPDYDKQHGDGFDFNDAKAVRRLIIDSVNRCDDAIGSVVGEEPVNINHIKRDDEHLAARVEIGSNVVHDLSGQPLRADLTVTMSRKLPNDNTDDYYQSEKDLNTVTAFVNLEYTLPEQGAGMMMQTQEPKPPFVPTIIVTSVSNAPWVRANTPELYFLAMSNAYRLTAGMVWAESLYPKSDVKGVDPRDIGAIGYLVNGQKAPTRGKDFQTEHFVRLMREMVFPRPSFLIDINPVGDNSGVENYLVDAAFGGDNKLIAKDIICDAIDNLTNNEFSKLFDRNQMEIAVPYGNNQEVHIGHYQGEDGEWRDIRDLDTIAMLNYTEGNREEFDEWYSTYVNDEEPFEVRMSRRERLERHYLSPSLKITGRAYRLMLTPEFVDALDEATFKSGAKVNMDMVANIMAAQRYVSNQQIAQYAVSGTARTGSYGATPTSTSHNYRSGISARGRYPRI